MHMREPQVQWIRKLVLKEGEANRCPANSVNTVKGVNLFTEAIDG